MMERRARHPAYNNLWVTMHIEKRWLGGSTALPPPLPPDSPNEAKMASMQVLQHTLCTSETWRSMEQTYALSLPLACATPEEWVQRTRCKAHEHAIKAGLTMALNPGCSVAWASAQVGGKMLQQYVVRGLALNARFHPFTRLQLQAQCDKLSNYRPRTPREMHDARLDAVDALLRLRSTC